MSEATERYNPAPFRKLGRLPHDPVALASAPQLAGHPFATTAPRAVVDRREVPFQPGLYDNDTLPDCTAAGLAAARSHGALAVEMEAAALYAFARARHRDVLCFAHVTNQMAVVEGDFEKGEADGARDSLDLIAAVARACGSGS